MTVTPLSRSANPVAPRLLTLKQAAEYIGCSYWTTRDLALNGTIPVVRVPSGRIPTGRSRGGRPPARVLVPATDSRIRSLRRVLVDRFDLDALIERWKATA